MIAGIILVLGLIVLAVYFIKKNANSKKKK